MHILVIVIRPPVKVYRRQRRRYKVGTIKLNLRRITCPCRHPRQLRQGPPRCRASSPLRAPSPRQLQIEKRYPVSEGFFQKMKRDDIAHTRLVRVQGVPHRLRVMNPKHSQLRP